MLKSYKVASALAILIGVISQSSIAAPCTFLANATTPIFISAAGRYCLTRDVVSNDGSSIWIQTDNVTLDLLGHKVSTRFVSPFGSTGIDASNNRLFSGNAVTEIKTPSTVQFAIGISVLPNASAGAPSGFLDIAGNFVSNAAPTANGKGIYLAAGVSHSVVHDSVIGGMNTGIYTAAAGGSALYLYNSVSGAAAPYFGGILGPNNRAQ